MRHLSASQILCYSQCGRQYWFHYIKQIKKPTISPHLIFGSALHASLEDLHKSLAGIPITIEELFSSFDNHWNNEIKNSEVEFKKTMHDDLYTIGVKSLELYYKNYLNFKPLTCLDKNGNKQLAVEYEFIMPVVHLDGTEDKNYYLLGVIDLIAEKDDKIIITDHKTSKNAYDEFKIDTSIQLPLYSCAMRYMLQKELFPDIKKKKEDLVAYNVFLKDYKTKEPKIIQYERKITQQHIRNLQHIIDGVIKGIENKIYIPNYGDHCNWSCDFKEECLKFKIKQYGTVYN